MTDPWRAPGDVVGRVRKELAQARRTAEEDAGHRGPQAAERPEMPAARGHALDGRVQVTVTAGRVSDVTLDPRALRAPSEDLAAAIREAVNAAIDAHNAQAVAGLPGRPFAPRPQSHAGRGLRRVSTGDGGGGTRHAGRSGGGPTRVRTAPSPAAGLDWLTDSRQTFGAERPIRKMVRPASDGVRCRETGRT